MKEWRERGRDVGYRSDASLSRRGGGRVGGVRIEGRSMT